MTCPACSHTFDVAATIRGVTICRHCYASVVVATGQRATGQDTTGLAPDDLKALRDLRTQLRKAAEVEP